MREKVAIAALLALAGCEREPTPEEQAMADARDVAMVEAANDVMPPLEEVTPEPILLPDIERWDLYGEACNYAPGTSLGTRVVAREADAFVKIEGQVHRLAADPGSRELPMHTRTLYNGKEYSLRLTMVPQDGSEGEDAEGATDYEGTVILRDQWGRVVYDGTGLAQCKA
jgi:hypothetical protein